MHEYRVQLEIQSRLADAERARQRRALIAEARAQQPNRLRLLVSRVVALPTMFAAFVRPAIVRPVVPARPTCQPDPTHF
jgi:hypothetical protein